jgi:hypothetical protein
MSRCWFIKLFVLGLRLRENKQNLVKVEGRKIKLAIFSVKIPSVEIHVNFSTNYW